MFLCYNIADGNPQGLNVFLITLLCLANLSFITYISWRMFYIVRYFFKKVQGTNAREGNQKAIAAKPKKKQHESDDEEQKNYLMLAEMEYNHQKIELEDENVGKIVVKEGEQNNTSNSEDEEEVALHCPETE